MNALLERAALLLEEARDEAWQGKDEAEAARLDVLAAAVRGRDVFVGGRIMQRPTQISTSTSRSRTLARASVNGDE